MVQYQIPDTDFCMDILTMLHKQQSFWVHNTIIQTQHWDWPKWQIRQSAIAIYRDIQIPFWGEFPACSEEIQIICGEKDQKLNTTMQYMTRFLQRATELVKPYTNWIKPYFESSGRTYEELQEPIQNHVQWTTSAKCIFVSGSLGESLGVVRQESQGSQLPEFTGPMHWPSGSPGSNSEKSGWTKEVWWQPGEGQGVLETSLGVLTRNLGVPTTSPGAAGSTSEQPGSTSNHCRAVWEKQHLLWECCCCAWKCMWSGQDWANLEATMEHVWKYLWRRWLCLLGDAFWRPWSSRDWWRSWRRLTGGAPGAWESIHQLVLWHPMQSDKVIYLWALMQSWLIAVDHVRRHTGS